MLYMLPGMLNHVRGMDMSISFNADRHTRKCAIKEVLALAKGTPMRNVYYNSVIALGMCMGLLAQSILPLYGSYLNYVS